MAGSKKPRKTKGNYCFPNFLGKAMTSVGQRVQFESTLLAIVFILIGILVMAIVTIFGTNFSLFIKIMAGINGIAALLFLSSHLITTFQQYQAYLSIMGILEVEQKEGSKVKEPPKEKAEIKIKPTEVETKENVPTKITYI